MSTNFDLRRLHPTPEGPYQGDNLDKVNWAAPASAEAALIRLRATFIEAREMGQALIGDPSAGPILDSDRFTALRVELENLSRIFNDRDYWPIRNGQLSVLESAQQHLEVSLHQLMQFNLDRAYRLAVLAIGMCEADSGAPAELLVVRRSRYIAGISLLATGDRARLVGAELHLSKAARDSATGQDILAEVGNELREVPTELREDARTLMAWAAVAGFAGRGIAVAHKLQLALEHSAESFARNGAQLI